jgi:acetylornithine deacetylase
VKGVSGHAAYSGGVNAIEKAIVVIKGIERFKQKRMKEQPSCRFNLGMFHAGIQPSVIPGKAELGVNICYSSDEAEYNLRKGNGWGGVSVRKEFERYVKNASRRDEWLTRHPGVIEWTKDLVPFVTDINLPVVQELRKSCYLVLGKKVRPVISPAWLDASNIARFGIPVVAFGPGSDNQAHSSEESISISDMVKSAKIMAVYLYRRLSKKPVI